MNGKQRLVMQHPGYRLCSVFLLWGLLLMSVSSVHGATGGQAMTAVSGYAPAQPFHLLDLDDGMHHLRDYRGKVMIVNFWASWCSPCREEFSSMNRAWAELQRDGVVMLAINVGEDVEAVSAFVQDFPIDFTVLLDSYGNISKRWRVTGMPTSFIVNTRGHIAYRGVGGREWDDPELLQLVRELIPGEPGS